MSDKKPVTVGVAAGLVIVIGLAAGLGLRAGASASPAKIVAEPGLESAQPPLEVAQPRLGVAEPGVDAVAPVTSGRAATLPVGERNAVVDAVIGCLRGAGFAVATYDNDFGEREYVIRLGEDTEDNNARADACEDAAEDNAFGPSTERAEAEPVMTVENELACLRARGVVIPEDLDSIEGLNALVANAASKGALSCMGVSGGEILPLPGELTFEE